MSAASFQPTISERPIGDSALDYTDGSVSAKITLGEVAGRSSVTIHEWSSHDPGRGNTTRALEWLRERFDIVIANGVGEIDDDGELPGVGDTSTLYWEHMRAKGLVDVLVDDLGRELPLPDGDGLYHLHDRRDGPQSLQDSAPPSRGAGRGPAAPRQSGDAEINRCLEEGMQVEMMPHGMERYAEVVNGNRRAIVWREGQVSLYVNGQFDSAAPIRDGNLKQTGIAMARAACRAPANRREAPSLER